MLESFLFWLIVATCISIVGYALTQGTGKRAFVFSGAASGLLALALGAVLVFMVDTDSKSIRRTFRQLEESVESNDAEGASAFLTANANKCRQTLLRNMQYVKFSGVKIREFKIEEINAMTSPPRAIVSFRGFANGVAGHSGGYPFNGAAYFKSVELRKEQDGVWRITDNITFDRVF